MSARVRRTIWTPAPSSRRKQRIDEHLHSFLFFFGTMLDDTQLHTQLLADKGAGFKRTWFWFSWDKKCCKRLTRGID